MRGFILSLLAFVSVLSFAQEKQDPALWIKDYTRLKGTTIELTKSKYNTSINVFVSLDKEALMLLELKTSITVLIRRRELII